MFEIIFKAFINFQISNILANEYCDNPPNYMDQEECCDFPETFESSLMDRCLSENKISDNTRTDNTQTYYV